VWWAFDVATLWATFDSARWRPVAAAGRVGGAEGGMVGTFAASGMDAGLALVAVVSYQVISTYAPPCPDR
jgi:uncharacterized membrane protein YbhN (UPF0104 family)